MLINPLTPGQQERIAELKSNIDFAKIKRFRIIRLVVMSLLFLSGLILGPLGLWISITFHLAEEITVNMIPLVVVSSLLVGLGISGFIVCFIILYLKKSPSRGITSGRANNTLPTAKRAEGIVVEMFVYQKKLTRQQEEQLHLANELGHIANQATGGTGTTLFGREATRWTDMTGTGGHKYIAIIYCEELDSIFLSGWDNGNGYGNGSDRHFCPELYEDISFYYDPKNPKWAWIEGTKGSTKRERDAKLVDREKVISEKGRKGDDRLEFELKDLYTRLERTAAEIAEIKKQSSEGNALKQITLACMYIFGDGVRKNNDKAVALLTKACEQNNLFAWQAFNIFRQFTTAVKPNFAYNELSKRREEIEQADIEKRKNQQ